MSEWLAYDALEPMGHIQPTYMAAMICTMVVNVLQAFAGKDKRRPISPSDFIPEWYSDSEPVKEEEKPEGQSIEEMKAVMKQLAAAFGKGSKYAKQSKVRDVPMKKRHK